MVELIRTVKTRLKPDTKTAQLFEDTQHLYTECFNQCAQWGWNHQTFSRSSIHKANYAAFRTEHPALKSQLVISAITRACEALKSALTLLKKHNKDPKHNRCPSCPRAQGSLGLPIRYDSHKSYWIDCDQGRVRLTVAGAKPVKIPFKIPDALAHYRDWTTASAELSRDRQGRWWLNVSVKTEVLEPEPKKEKRKEKKIVGIDLGINVPAMDSEGTPYGNEHWKVIEQRYALHTARLQAKGTKSARRRLKSTSGRQRRFRRDCDHVLSKRIVQSVNAGDVLVMEDLTGLRKRVKMRKEQRKRVHRWSFAQLQGFVKYKATGAGITSEWIDPSYTSQTCNQCGHRDKKNRQTQAQFCCKKCGHTANADHNAACNIRDKFLNGLPVNQPLVASPNLLLRLELQAPTSAGGGC